MSDHRRNPLSKLTDVRLPEVIRDIYGRILQEGDQIHVQSVTSQPYRIMQIHPVLDPTAPNNLMEMTIVSTLRFRAVRNQVNAEFVRVMEAADVPQEARALQGDGSHDADTHDE